MVPNLEILCAQHLHIKCTILGSLCKKGVFPVAQKQMSVNCHTQVPECLIEALGLLRLLDSVL